MKVLPIGAFEQNYQRIGHDSNNKENSYSNNNFTDLNLLNKNYNQISFGAIPNSSVKAVRQLPLEDRLASIMEMSLQGDLILIGKSIHKAKERMLANLDLLEEAVKRVFFIPDNKINAYLGFSKTKEGLNQLINLNDFELVLLRTQSEKSDCLMRNNSFIVYNGDTICIKDRSFIDIKEAPAADFNSKGQIFCEAKDFTALVNQDLLKLNKKMVSLLSKDEKATPRKVTFKDVGGQDALIEDLKKSVIYPLKYPEAYRSFDINRGFILYGPPGTGKTHIARALANEADVNFISLNGVEMESKWVGESEQNWRNLFDEAKQKQPTIMFIDEFDAIAKSRGGKDVYGDKVVNQILTLMTDLDNNAENVFVIGATNNFQALDSAIIRSGRFSKHLEVKMPDLNGTRKILDIHTAKKPLARSVDRELLTNRLYDLKTSGADIKYIVNEAHSAGYDRAGIFEKMENGTLKGKDISSFRITTEDFDKAIAKFVETRKGSERRPIGFIRK